MNIPDRFSLSRATSVGLLLAVLMILFGQGLGIVFGLNEAAIKSRLKASAVEVRDTVYRNDDVAIKAVQDKAWIYMQRAHLHAGAMGGNAPGLIILVVLLGTSPHIATATTIAARRRRFGLLSLLAEAGFRAPSLGGTTPAKESLERLAMPSSGAFVLATVTVIFRLIAAVVTKKSTDPLPASVRRDGNINHQPA